MQPQRRQPTRLPRPWDSPDKNAGVGCHFLLQSMKVKSESEVAQYGLILSDPMDCSLPGSSVHGIFQARVLEWGAIAFSQEQFSLILFTPYRALTNNDDHPFYKYSFPPRFLLIFHPPLWMLSPSPPSASFSPPLIGDAAVDFDKESEVTGPSP